MSPDERDRLLLACLDGTASPSERATVEATLASSLEWRERHAELAALFGELNRVERIEPPADLRARVLDGIHEVERGRHRAATVKSRVGWIAWLTRLGPRPRVLVAASFTAGLVLGAVAMGPALHEFGGDSRILGTMGGAGAAVALTRNDARITASAAPVEAGWSIAVEVALPAGVTAEMADPEGLRTPVAVRRPAGSDAVVSVDGHRVLWKGPARGRFRVDFARVAGTSSPLQLTLMTATGRSHTPLPLPGSPVR